MLSKSYYSLNCSQESLKRSTSYVKMIDILCVQDTVDNKTLAIFDGKVLREKFSVPVYNVKLLRTF